MSSNNEQPVPTYSLGQPSKRTGLGGLSMKTTAVIGAGFMLFLLMILGGQGLIAFTVVLPVTIAVAVLITVTWQGRSIAQIIQLKWQSFQRHRHGEDFYMSGPSSKVPGGRWRMPGLLARTEVVEATDANGQTYAVIIDRPRRRATVCFDTQLSGQTAMTQSERDQITASWGRWLATLSLTGDIDTAVVVIGSRPATGELLSKEVDSTVHDDAPEIARRIQFEAAQVLRGGLAELESHVAVTFKIHSSGQDDFEFLSQIGTRLPGLYESLSWAGMQSSPMDENTLVSRVHSMVNPSTELDFEEMMVEGRGHGLKWEDCGPSVAWVDGDVWHHEAVASVSWEMADAPRSTFEDTLLAPLLMPHERIDRKRVAIVYRPYEAGTGASRVEAEHQDAMVGVNSSKKIASAKAEMRLEHTEAARRAQARGAQLGRISLFVTATTDDVSNLPRLRDDIRQQAAQCNLRLRTMKNQPDVGFTITTGVGQTPWAKASTATMMNAG
ncbi:SCO6880 family protein [Ancrocorticia populi]|uniref:SCO6880 family protein n=1 Tax=Ancrocorticia populi TaxID=2175228 RepID=UPI003F98DA6D